jgi:hypothetical protein
LIFGLDFDPVFPGARRFILFFNQGANLIAKKAPPSGSLDQFIQPPKSGSIAEKTEKDP